MRLLKYIVYVLMVCIALLIGGAVFISNYINPNDYKPQISAYVAEKTGRTLSINGNISWSFFPWLGISIKDAQLSNAPGFGTEPFAKVQEAAISVKLLPLFQKQLEIDSLLLKGMELRLTKNAQGITNWQDLNKQKSSADTTKPSSVSTENKHENSAKQAFTFSIADIDISDSRLIWNNQQTKQLINLHDIELYAENIHQKEKIPLTLSFIADINQKKISFKISSNLQIMPEKIQFLDIKTHFDNTELTGNISINNHEASDISFEAILNQIQLDRYLESKEKPAKLLISNFKTKGTVKSGIINGHLQIGELHAGEIHANNINSQFNLQDDVIRLSPITAQLYQGQSHGSIEIDTRSNETHLSVRQMLSGIQIEPLLHDLKPLTQVKLSGAANLDTHLFASGKDTAALTRSLNGQIKFSINKGELHGIDLDRAVSTFIETMDTLIRNIKSSPAEMLGAVTGKVTPVLENRAGQTTHFNTFTGNITITNGTASNKDLLILTPSMKITGAGTANLVAQNIDYRLSALKNNPKTNQPYDYELPILITGPMANPSIRLDSSYVNQVIQKEIARVAKNKLSETISKNIGGEAGQKIGEQLKNLNLDKLFK